ncbi:MAG: alpha/beta hydrolase family protein [Terriglobia bacterium]|jgi:S-formylglutathione hydrolase FrmB
MKIRLAIIEAAFTAILVSAGLLAKDYDTVEMAAAHLGGMTVGFNIILPRDYATTTQRYPVLYLLHGYTDHYPAWASYSRITDYARGYDEIVVMPEGDNGFYTNSYADKNLAWEDFILLDLIPYVDGHYRTAASRQGRAIAGLSMGGYGAMKIGLKHPQMFAAAASLSGALAAARWKRRPIDDPVFQKLVDGVYGPPDSPTRAAEDPFELIKKVPADLRPQIYFSVGSEDFLLEENHEFAKHLSELKVPYQYREFPGKHEWPVWDREIQVVLALQAPVIGAMRGGTE